MFNCSDGYSGLGVCEESKDKQVYCRDEHGSTIRSQHVSVWENRFMVLDL